MVEVEKKEMRPQTRRPGIQRGLEMTGLLSTKEYRYRQRIAVPGVGMIYIHRMDIRARQLLYSV